MSGRWDPTGSVVLGLRADPDVTSALASAGGDGNYLRVVAGGPKTAPPYIVVIPTGVNPNPFGQRSNRIGLARHQYAFRCVAPATLANGQANARGAAQAAALAGAVATYLAQNGWNTRTVGASNYATVASREESTAGASEDPDTKDPLVVIVGSLVASVQALG